MEIQGIASLNTLKIKGFENVLSKLNVGDKITVEVVAINNNEITLKLPNGEKINASLMMALDVMPGDSIELSLKDRAQSQVVFQTTKLAQGENNLKQIENILLSIKLTPDDRNINIAKELIKQNVPLSKENFLQIINTMSQFDIEVNKAVFMVANNVNQVENGLDILNNIISKQETLTNLIQLLSDNLDLEQNNNVVNKIINTFEAINLIKNVEIENENISKVISNFLNNKNELTEPSKGINSFSNIDNQVKELSKSIIKQMLNLNTIFDTNDMIKNDNITEKALDKIIKNIDENLNNTKISTLLKNNPDLKNKMFEYINNELELNKFVLEHSNVNELSNNSEKSQDISTKTKNYFNISNLINEGSLEDKINVNKIYNELMTKLEIIENESSNGNLAKSDDILNILGKIRNTISTINNINNMFYYFQLPLVVNSENTNVELYIAKNNQKRNKIDPNNTSLFISLNTKNLGLVESMISIKNRKIDFNFKLQNNKIIEFIKKNERILSELIELKGYEVNKITYKTNSEATNLLNVNLNTTTSDFDRRSVDFKI